MLPNFRYFYSFSLILLLVVFSGFFHEIKLLQTCARRVTVITVSFFFRHHSKAKTGVLALLSRQRQTGNRASNKHSLCENYKLCKENVSTVSSRILFWTHRRIEWCLYCKVYMSYKKVWVLFYFSKTQLFSLCDVFCKSLKNCRMSFLPEVRAVLNMFTVFKRV